MSVMSGSQPEEKNPVLDRTLNRSKSQLQLGEAVLDSFCAEEQETEGE